MYEVRSKVQGSLVFDRIGKAFGRAGQTGTMEDSDLKDPEVRKALQDGRLEILRERQVQVEESTRGDEQSVLMSKKDWARFRQVMLECTGLIQETIREEAEKLREDSPLSQRGRPRVIDKDSIPRRRSRRSEEVDYIITPSFSDQEARMDTETTSEDGGDLSAGLAALRELHKGDDDGR